MTLIFENLIGFITYYWLEIFLFASILNIIFPTALFKRYAALPGLSVSLALFWVFLLLFYFLSVKTNFLVNRCGPFIKLIFYLDFSHNLMFFFGVGLDNISILFILLTLFIFSLCYFYLFEERFFIHHVSYFILALSLLQFFIILSFLMFNVFLFYYCFESVLVPIYILIVVWGGSKARKLKAANYLFLYTAFFSTFMLYAIIYLYINLGWQGLDFTITPTVLYLNNLSLTQEKYIWLAFCLAFAVKMPVFPIHLWLPEAHVEAPTVGSVLLASLLLKLGGFGFVRFLIPSFKDVSYYFLPVIFGFACSSILYGSLIAMRQPDIKKIIAYSSIVHMNFAMLGLFSFSVQGIQGGILLLLMHGFVSAGLFFLVGILYRRFETRLINYYSGLAQTMPLYTVFFFVLSLANLGFPLSGNFIGEMLIFIGLYTLPGSDFVFIFCALGFIVGVIYSIWTFNRICFGEINTNLTFQWYDLSYNELLILVSLILPTLLFGLKPNIILGYNYLFAALICS